MDKIHIKIKNKPAIGVYFPETGETTWFWATKTGKTGKELTADESAVAERIARGEMSFQEAKEIRGKSFGNLMSEKLVAGGGIGSSLKATISEKMKARAKGMKEKFDPMNIAKFMTGGSSLGAAVMGRMTGRSKEDMEHFTGQKARQVGGGDTATKVGSLKEGNELLDILMKIYTLMQSSHAAEVKNLEEENNYKEENDAERERRNKALLDALKGKKEAKTADKLEKEEPGLFDGILDMFGLGANGLSILKTLGSFLISPLGLALVGFTAASGLILYLMSQASPEAHAEASKVQNAGDVSNDGKAIMEAASDAVAARKNNILLEANKKGKFKTPWYNFSKRAEEEKKYLQEIGFDEKTGLTASEKELGYTTIDDAGNPIRPKEKATPASPTATPTTPSSPASQPVPATAKADDAGGTATTSPVPPSSPATSGGGGGGSSAATGKESETSAVPVAGSLSSGEEIVEPSSSGAKLASVTSENLDSKLPTPTEDSESGVTVNNVNKKTTLKESTQAQLPFVRNQEETFQRMIMRSTRVV